ncbi:threonylcarbamoyladenosine tRNA methylthiotransferase MtaB [Natronincola peptidivorans]|uniref:Threonylcarbamoyladenosine tRNA methylthiotransferase MtaB n=1 Tax=Natronincola peptidivorans TaxID=426128 RepID=A0A1I0E9C7_9FIRM|nr:tRNA (N(6)-L-threonylcarbamoyladenosine(37)-C(2))-methylthiotransferase MtaB [Natronincola peptidivorans]SET41619.1 threonylcarbamoyladenosine tRNA methylthiotransferase MtaB [Natronincola peptidivorans]
MKTVAFHTLGCKVNQYETQAMGELFENKGYTLVDDTEVADVYVINTCTVTNIGDKKSRQFIRRVKRNNPDAIIAVVGCYAQTAPEEVLEIEGVNIVIGTNDRNRIVQLVEDSKINEKVNLVDDIMKVKEFEEMTIKDVKEQTRAFLKIQEGCNQYCAYCIIPYARGPIRSRKKADIVKEVKSLVSSGFKEVVLTGIHVASYGKDLDGEDTLIEVLKEVNAIEGLERIRLSSLEPTLFTEDFLQELSKLHKLCEHFHLSLQSGCDKILKKMNRKYTTGEYRKIVQRIRRVYPKIALTTDIIVGFPGETPSDFEATYDFVKEIGFSSIHVFKYSPRKGTPAATFKEQVDGKTKHTRSEKLISLGEELRKEYYLQFVGDTKTVLFETETKDLKGYMEGNTDNYLKVVVKGDQSLEGKILNINLESFQGEYMMGKIIQNS